MPPSSVVSPLTSVEPDYTDSSEEEEDRGANIYEQVSNSTQAKQVWIIMPCSLILMADDGQVLNCRSSGARPRLPSLTLAPLQGRGREEEGHPGGRGGREEMPSPWKGWEERGGREEREEEGGVARRARRLGQTLSAKLSVRFHLGS